MQSVSIIVPLYNRADLTGQLLERMAICHAGRCDYEIIAVDDGSTDSTKSLPNISWNVPIRWYTEWENRGFSHSCNIGASMAQGDILLFLNNDVIVEGDIVTPVQDIFGSDGELIVAGAEVLRQNTGWNKFIRHDTELIVEYVAGWCLAIKKSRFNELGGFDAGVFSPYDYEDVDLSYHHVCAGGVIKQINNFPARHLSGQSFGGALSMRRRQVTEAHRQAFADKWGLTII